MSEAEIYIDPVEMLDLSRRLEEILDIFNGEIAEQIEILASTTFYEEGAAKPVIDIYPQISKSIYKIAEDYTRLYAFIHYTTEKVTEKDRILAERIQNNEVQST
ncbi:hypothetical protein [Isobaculum melis]|uniref:Uncharacterized protein n=1 Tax=Isobaculum melis TaxID=142588 RepID=A0A1H9PWZ8_9LACT|nr:hypothetical protein [Isobaculum melis]SER52690.1 hypothetical protein SAMN04488559_101200 [Isobaculum melis]